MRAAVRTGGETLAITSEISWASRIIEAATASEPVSTEEPSIRVRIESLRAPFDLTGAEPLARGMWRRDGELIATNVCATGFDLHAVVDGDGAALTYRWRPAPRERVAAAALRVRFTLLARQLLLQYPVLWRAGTRGRAPLHASACRSGDAIALVCGAGGVGKSTALLREIERGGVVTDDNVSVSDGVRIWGVAEPMRIESGSGKRTTFGRREQSLSNRVPELSPDVVVVLRRGSSLDVARETTSDVAERAIVAATYMAGELRRYWGFAASLGLALGQGDAHARVAETARAFTKRLPCFEVWLPKDGAPLLGDILSEARVRGGVA